MSDRPKYTTHLIIRKLYTLLRWQKTRLGELTQPNSASCLFSGAFVQVHEDEDDLGRGNYSDSLTTGHAGPRYGCCIIKETTGNI